MRNYVIALYIRLSVEDFKTESLSIPNQKLILREKAMSLPEWDNSEILEFIDNGHTGTNFERPAVQELLTMVQAGKINCIIVKDLSRFARDYVGSGYYLEKLFPSMGVRFIVLAYPIIAYLWLEHIDLKKYKWLIYAFPFAFLINIKNLLHNYMSVTPSDFFYTSPIYLVVKYLF